MSEGDTRSTNHARGITVGGWFGVSTCAGCGERRREPAAWEACRSAPMLCEVERGDAASSSRRSPTRRPPSRPLRVARSQRARIALAAQSPRFGGCPGLCSDGGWRLFRLRCSRGRYRDTSLRSLSPPWEGGRLLRNRAGLPYVVGDKGTPDFTMTVPTPQDTHLRTSACAHQQIRERGKCLIAAGG